MGTEKATFKVTTDHQTLLEITHNAENLADQALTNPLGIYLKYIKRVEIKPEDKKKLFSFIQSIPKEQYQRTTSYFKKTFSSLLL